MTEAIRKLAQEAEAEIEARKNSPGGREFRLTVDAEAEGVERSNTGFDRLMSIGGRLQSALRHFHEQELGMTLQKAKEELERLQGLVRSRNYRQGRAKCGGFKSLGQIEKAKKVVGFTARLRLSVRSSRLAPLIIEVVQTKMLANERAAQREKLRNEVSVASKELSIDYWEEWKALADGLREWLAEQQKPLTGIITNLLSREHKLERGRRRFRCDR